MINSFHAGLLLHTVGLTMVAGTTLVSYVIFRRFWRQYEQNKEKGNAIMQALSKLPWLSATGLGLQIISGGMMLAAMGGGFGQQLWFKLKMILVVLVIAGSIVLNRGLQSRLRRWVLDDITYGYKGRQIKSLAGRIHFVQLFLLFFLVTIFILSVFKFN